MYERSAIVLERYLDKLFGFNKENNLKDNFSDFKDLIEDLKEYQSMISEEEKVIKKFDDIAKEIQAIQKLQEKLCLSNQKLEDERNKLFNAIDENPNIVQNKLEKIEKIVEENNEELKKIREEYIRAFVIFIERQKERNKCAREKRSIESNHIQTINRTIQRFQDISVEDVQKIKKFINSDKQAVKVNIIDTMIKNGKNEKIGFNEKVINKAVDVRISICEREAECYITIYEKFKKILSEIESDNLKLNKYEKVLRDVGVKLAFLDAEKDYIVEFLDNERMTAMGGAKTHQRMMEQACESFEMDINQIDNLYELILREIAGRSTKKAYKELYNKNYLSDIQEKERNFEQELTNIKLNMGAVINSNYWRIEGIKNVYEVFQKEVTEKFDKDLSEYRVGEINQLLDLAESLKLKTQLDIKPQIEYINNTQQNILEYSNKYENDNSYNEEIYEDNNEEYNKYEDDTYYEEDEYENDDYYDEEDEEYEDDYYDEDEYESDYEEYYDEEDDYDIEDDYEEEYEDDEDDEYEENMYEKKYNRRSKEIEENENIKEKKRNNKKGKHLKNDKKSRGGKRQKENNKGIFNKIFGNDNKS